VHPDTELTTGVQGDVSVAAWLWDDEGFALSVIAGYRHMVLKWAAYSGSYLYSVSAFRDTAGTLPYQLAITYQQWWPTPYAGFGLSYAVDDLVVTGEVIGSGLVNARAKDYHALRDILFEDKFSPSFMVGATVGVEYRFSEAWSAVGRVEYQRYFEAEGRTKITHPPAEACRGRRQREHPCVARGQNPSVERFHPLETFFRRPKSTGAKAHSGLA
jgi:plasminogen activator